MDNGEDAVGNNPTVTNLFGEIQHLTITSTDSSDGLKPSCQDKPPDYSKDREEMLDHVAKSDAHFKHQQLGEPDLTYSEKLTIASEWLDKNPGIFLERFGKYLTRGDLSYFEQFRSDYIVDYHLREISKRLYGKSNLKRVKNRRYEKMRRLVCQGEYFSDEEMKRRDPLLYEQMIGQHLTSNEIKDQAESATVDGNLSSLLLKHLQAMQNNELYEELVEKQECCMEEQEDDEDDDGDDKMDSENDDCDEAELEEIEKERLREEFLATMKQRFLDGKDSDFNYSEVDDNTEYDSYDLFSRDEEDRYFDDDADDDDDGLCSD